MQNPEYSSEYQLDPEADAAVTELVNDFRRLLVSETRQLAFGEPLHPHHLRDAWKILVRTSPRDAQTIISRALRENRFFELGAYILAAILFAFGITLFSVGIFADSDVTYRTASIFGGAVVEILLILPLRYAVVSRRHNIAIRMLGLLIDRVDDPQKMAALLKETFSGVVLGSSFPLF